MADARTLYDDDFVAWTEQQAEALRSAARGSTNQPLDWENLAEEIESLGKSDRRELHSQIYRIIRHLAKLQFSSADDPRRGWRESVVDARMQTELVLADSPSLRRELERIVATQTPKATKRATFDLGSSASRSGHNAGVAGSGYPWTRCSATGSPLTRGLIGQRRLTKTASEPSEMIDAIPAPADDWHVHFRDGACCGRCCRDGAPVRPGDRHAEPRAAASDIAAARAYRSASSLPCRRRPFTR
jgi:hypothetical protein